MKIGIIGYGVVGGAIDATMSEKYEVKKFDKYVSIDSFTDILDCDIIFISVPTPFDCVKNEVNDSAILESLEKLKKSEFKGITVIKSTVPPGKCTEYQKKYNLSLVFNPEFLRESTTPVEDFANQEHIVIGTDRADIFDKIKSMYEKVSVSHAKYYHLTFTEAEMIKYAQNTMLASRVALANIIYDACEQYDLDYNLVREIAFDSFEILGPHMAQVPGPDGKRGFGGKCLPKDIRGFSTIHDSKILEDIISYNDNLRDDLDKFLDGFKK